MNEHEIRLIIEAQNRAERAIRELQQSSRQASRTVERDWDNASRSNIRSGNRFFETMKRGFSSLGTAIRSITSSFGGFGAALAGIGVFKFGKDILSAGIQLETMKNGLRAVVGSAEEASRTLARLQKIAQLPGIDLKQAIQASINLRSVKLSAELTERSLKAVGNALAIVGKPGELDGVVLGMTQMVSAGKVLQEEINQIASRIPQFRQAMIEAFGTARSEDIQKMGISVETFLSKTVAELEKLPKATGGAQNAVSNLKNAFFEFNSTIGTHFLPAFTAVVDGMTAALTGASAAFRRFTQFAPANSPISIIRPPTAPQFAGGLGGGLSRSDALSLYSRVTDEASRQQLRQVLFAPIRRQLTETQRREVEIAQVTRGASRPIIGTMGRTRAPGTVPGSLQPNVAPIGAGFRVDMQIPGISGLGFPSPVKSEASINAARFGAIESFRNVQMEIQRQNQVLRLQQQRREIPMLSPTMPPSFLYDQGGMTPTGQPFGQLSNSAKDARFQLQSLAATVSQTFSDIVFTVDTSARVIQQELGNALSNIGRAIAGDPSASLTDYGGRILEYGQTEGGGGWGGFLKGVGTSLIPIYGTYKITSSTVRGRIDRAKDKEPRVIRENP